MVSKAYRDLVIAIFLIALSPIGVAYIMQYNNPEMSSVIYGVVGTFTLFVYMLLKGELKYLGQIKHHWKILFILGLLQGISTLLWFYSIKEIGASLTSFIGRTGTLMLIILSIFFLKERFNLFEGIGTFVTLAGTYILSFSPIDYLGWRITYIVLAGILYAINQIIIKKKINHIQTIVMVAAMAISVTLFVTIFTIALGKLEMPDIRGVLVSIPVTLLAEVLAGVLILEVYRSLDVAKVQIIRSSFPFIVVIYSFILYKEIPMLHQLIGGAMIILGIAILVFFRKTKAQVKPVPRI